MSIEARITVTLVDVEVTDEYMVDLFTPEAIEHRTTLTSDQAVQLAHELMKAAAESVEKLRVDLSRPRLAHGFDLVACVDCREGKHTACIGSALVERGDDVEAVPCQCAGAEHQVHEAVPS